MSEKDINRWHDAITPRDKAPQPWSMGSGGSWDMLEVQPIPDAMLAELAQRYHYAGTPWNCRSMPLSASDREYMYLLYSCMQGLVARMRQAERKAAEGPHWQPIETAPKDGSAILLGGHAGAWIGFWQPVYTSGYRPNNPWGSLMLNHDHMVGLKSLKPTHWMPLPAAPKGR